MNENSAISEDFIEHMVDRVILVLTDKLEQLDISLDYIGSLLSGLPAGDISSRQTRGGRLTTDIPASKRNIKESKIMKLSKARLRQIIKEEINEIIDLPLDYDTQASDQEREMDELSAEFEEIAKKTWLASTMVRDPLGGDEPMRLDEFLALLGNRVVSGDIDKRVAYGIAENILSYLDR